VGSDVTEFQAGDRVGWSGVPGCYAEYVLIPAERAVVLPEQLTLEDGAAAMLQGMTAHYLACSTYPLKPRDRCLVHAAAGGVGLLLVQIAKKRGATVYGTVSTPEKAQLATDAGADAVILYTEQDFEQEVNDLTGGQGLQVVYDSVGQATFEKSLNVLAPLGYLVLFGQSSGPVPLFDPSVLNTKGSLFLTRPTLFHYIADRPSLEKRAGEVLDWVASGDLKLRVEHKYPLSDAAIAHQDLESRKTTGKLLLIP
jgi:NADPH2:quinone reductase